MIHCQIKRKWRNFHWKTNKPTTPSISSWEIVGSAPIVKTFYLPISSSLAFETIGCYRDTGNRAIQPLEGKDSILDGSYGSRKNPIAKCAVAAMRAGYSMFALQAGGWCVASATAPKTFDKYGKSTACGSDGEGGGWANQVYLLKCWSVVSTCCDYVCHLAIT